MTLKEFKQKIKDLPNNSEIVFFEEGAAINEKGEKLMPGIGVFSLEDLEYIYLGDIAIVENDSDNR